jgi:hypothetical protein
MALLFIAIGFEIASPYDHTLKIKLTFHVVFIALRALKKVGSPRAFHAAEKASDFVTQTRSRNYISYQSGSSKSKLPGWLFRPPAHSAICQKNQTQLRK